MKDIGIETASVYLTYIDAYADNPQAEINRLLAQGVSETDPRVLALKSLMAQIKLKNTKSSARSGGLNDNTKKSVSSHTVNGLDVSGTDYQRVLANLGRYYDSPMATDNGAKTIINSDMWMSDADKDKLIVALGL